MKTNDIQKVADNEEITKLKIVVVVGIGDKTSNRIINTNRENITNMLEFAKRKYSSIIGFGGSVKIKSVKRYNRELRAYV